MLELTILLALVFGSAEVALELAKSHPSIVLAVIFVSVLLLMLLLAEKPHEQPANEDHVLTPRVNGKDASGGDLPSLVSGAREREKAGENSSVQGAAPVEPSVPTDGAEALLMPLVSQFVQMQQQMFGQFQQTLMIMAEMFGNMQREQMALIRQLLEQIRELTRQLYMLQSEGIGQSASPLPASLQAATPSLPMPSLSSEPTDFAAPADTPSAKLCDADVHVWLSQRLATLEQERHSR